MAEVVGWGKHASGYIVVWTFFLRSLLGNKLDLTHHFGYLFSIVSPKSGQLMHGQIIQSSS
jgi:hypothetical protein